MSMLRGTFTAMITPFLEDGTVDYEGFRKLVEFQIEKGISGILPLGSTGETPTLFVEEEDKLVEIAVSVAAGRIPVIIGTGSNSTYEAVEYTKRAKKHNADYALVVTPYYNKPTDTGIYNHFKAVSEVGIPILVYNIASRTGKNISAELLTRIAELPNIAGVKEASGDVTQVMNVIHSIKKKRPDFSVLSGDDGLALPLIAAGADGVISVASNLVPERVQEMVTVLLNGDFEKGRELHYKLLPLFQGLFIETNPIPIKTAMKWKGLPSGGLRLPLCPLQPENEPKLRAALAASGISL